MNAQTMNFNEIYAFLQNGDETDRIEAKRAREKIGKSFLETVCAFSNEPDLGGGYILLGVSRNEHSPDFKYEITGVEDTDKLQQEIASQCRQCFNIPIRPTIKVITHDHGNVLLVYVPEASPHEKPIFIKKHGREKGAYIRIGSSDQVCCQDDLDLLYQLRSKRKFDASPVDQASIEDFDPQAIKMYRKEREKIKSNALELSYSDTDLLKALEAVITENGATYPTVAGLLLFGKHEVLRRTFALHNQVDYMLVEGREWVGDPDKRYTSLEICEPLILAIPKILYQVMNDIPQVFALDEEQIQRIDNPVMPRKVIREALVNALMHKDYRVASPTQIIKYANRIEFRNQGFSLKPQDQLGLPGSIPRNHILATVFQNINYAEAKGTGIRAMRDEMRKANLSEPLIETKREGNLFVLTLLSHHLFDKADIEWLGQFKEYNLSSEEAKTLIIIREMGAITNADYRMIHGVDTLTASAHLRKLRDLELIQQKGGSSATYYIPCKKLFTPDIRDKSLVGSGLSGELAHHVKDNLPSLPTQLPPQINSLSGESEPLCGEFPSLSGELATLYGEFPKELKEDLKKLGKRASPEKVKSIILRLCDVKPLKLAELSAFLKRDPKYIRENYLTSLTTTGKLELLHPHQPNHPHQAYRTKKP